MGYSLGGFTVATKKQINNAQKALERAFTRRLHEWEEIAAGNSFILLPCDICKYALDFFAMVHGYKDCIDKCDVCPLYPCSADEPFEHRMLARCCEDPDVVKKAAKDHVKWFIKKLNENGYDYK